MASSLGPSSTSRCQNFLPKSDMIRSFSRCPLGELAHREDAGQAKGAQFGNSLRATSRRGRENQGGRSGQGRTSVSDHQVPVWIHQSSISWSGQEHRKGERGVSAEQSVGGSKASFTRSKKVNPHNLPGIPLIAGKQSAIDQILITNRRKMAHQIFIQAL